MIDIEKMIDEATAMFLDASPPKLPIEPSIYMDHIHELVSSISNDPRCEGLVMQLSTTHPHGADHYVISIHLASSEKDNQSVINALNREPYRLAIAKPFVPNKVKIDQWKAEAALLIISQCHFSLNDALRFAEAAYDNIDGDIENESPQDCVDAEIDAMRAEC